MRDTSRRYKQITVEFLIYDFVVQPLSYTNFVNVCSRDEYIIPLPFFSI